MTYFIRANTEPQDRAELWLAVNAGSILEDEDQLGLAHFLEHMMFNGTERFPGMGVVDYLETVGMEFGPDVNAYTSFDETVYTIQVPTGDAEIVDQGFQVLEDWAHAATLDPDEVEKERGVIIEEWRLDQQSAAGRIQEQTLPTVLGESRYSERLPIGDMDIIRSAPAETLRRFYENWYRPDLMAVVAVGDFEDLDQIEEMIQTHFSSMTAPEELLPRETFTTPNTDGTDYLVVTDPEETTSELQIWRRREVSPLHTGQDYRELLVRSLFYSILDERFRDLERKPDAPFLSVSSGFGNYVRPLDVDAVFAQTEEGKITDGLDAVITELERVARHGFSASELERAKQDMLESYLRSYNERNNRDSAGLADEYIAYFLTGEASPGIEYEYELVQQLLDGITLDDVNAISSDLVADDNRVVILTAPEKDDLILPTEAELAAAVEQAIAREIDPLTEELVAGDLVESRPEPVAIVDERTLPDVGLTEITLENGVRVLLKQTDFKDDEVVFTGFSLGGSSLVSDDDFVNAASIVAVITESGVGNFGQSDLEKLLSGKSVSIVPYIRELTEGLEGGSSVKDLETLFQLIYLYATAPRADEDAFQVFQTQMRADLENRALSPNSALRDAIFESLYGDTVRAAISPWKRSRAWIWRAPSRSTTNALPTWTMPPLSSWAALIWKR